MESSKKYLLSTRPLPKAVVEAGARSHVIIDEFSFIDTAPVQDEELFQKIKALAAEEHVVVFTSMNAVEAVASQATEVPGWKIYSIGNTTRKLIEEKWGKDKLVATAENAQRLGERLIDDGRKDVIFFCGNKRRDELPNKMRSEGGKAEEIVVYETQETSSKLVKEYDGILFFSPSAVQAFYRQNQPAKNTVLFAIGKTTEEALQQQKAKKIVVAHVTDKVEMTQQAIRYLSQQKQ
ncbi:uroporphyrinogen-III synthase [Flavisolibacter nicotianae]|uniref:uroporphyrinogen-III synthase n=1 Tax=Flavisolibacter nicotianae TaxID=2364882 RepID=UPI000EB4A866|nr:uroporphyrinogen-III synthase [Flavisolibacter nicotianae]